MAFTQSLVRVLIIAGFLAAYDVYFKKFWSLWLEGQGETLGFGAAMIGYFVTLVLAYIISALLVRQLRREEVE